MYRFLSGLFFLLLFPCILLAQRPGGPPAGKGLTGAISGAILDSLTRQPVEYVSVGVFDVGAGKLVSGGLTDARGVFRIADLPAGEYQIQVTFIGYAAKTVTGIKLTPQRPDHQAGDIVLMPQDQLLREIQVVGEAALIEAKPDKIVYNAEIDVTTKGGDAADVLRKVPLLAVDLDGNVSMRGSENIRVLINGRPSSIFNSNLADALKMMPADQIKSVEVITSPSAKYDAEGTAGIINIITRKKNIEGLAGSADLTGGTRSNRGNLNLSYGRGRLGINVSGGGHYSWPQEGITTFRREDYLLDTLNLLLQDGTNTSSRLGFRSNAGVEYTINASNTINGSVSVRGYRTTNDNQVQAQYSLGDLLAESYQRSVDGKSNRTGVEWELDYKHTFPQKEREWSFAFELNNDQDRANASYDQTYELPVNPVPSLEQNINLGDNIEFTAQTDYVQPIREGIQLETGFKATLRDIRSDFNFSRYDPDQVTWVEDPERTDVFHYQQHVYAGYLSSRVKLGARTNLIAGVRLETTDLDGSFETFDNPFANQYSNLLPSITLSRRLGEFNQVKISYNQRIQRPSQRHINPYVEYNDNRDITYGNPQLEPELVHQVEIGTNVFIKGNMISVTIFGRRTQDLIESLLRINEVGVSETSYENFGIRSAAGMNVFGTLNLGKLSLRGGFDFNAWEVSGTFEQEDLTNSGFDYNGRINATWSIRETLKLEAFTFFRSPSYTVQGKNPNWSMMSFGIKKEMFKKRLSLGINISQPFQENQQYIREITGTDFYQYSKTVRPVRSFGINVGYRFGKLDFNERSGKKKVNNNDLKEVEPASEGQFQG